MKSRRETDYPSGPEENKQQSVVSPLLKLLDRKWQPPGDAQVLEGATLQPSDVQYNQRYQRFSTCRSRSSSSINWRSVYQWDSDSLADLATTEAEIQAQRAAGSGGKAVQEAQANKERQAQLQY